jgi:hypothetical protein
MRTIVRIEYRGDDKSEYGSGLFQSGIYNNLSNFWEFNDRHMRFPLPFEDTPSLNINKDKKEWFCAFKTMEQMNDWVTKEEVKEFIELDCVVLILDVTEYQEGEHQIIFTKESIIDSKDVTNLFK